MLILYACKEYQPQFFAVMTSLERITGSLLHSKAIQSTNHEHLQCQIQLREANRNSALMNLKLLVGDVQRRVRDMEEIDDRVQRLDDQLHQSKLKLSAVLLLLLKEQNRFDSLYQTVLHSDSCWDGFPHQLADVLKALDGRLTLLREVKKIRSFLRKAQRSFLLTWYAARVKKMAQNEVFLQKKEFSSILDQLNQQIDSTAIKKTKIEKRIQIAIEEKKTILEKLYFSQQRELTLEAEWNVFEVLQKNENEERGAIIVQGITAGNMLLNRLQEKKEYLLGHLGICRSNLQELRAEKGRMKEENVCNEQNCTEKLKTCLEQKEQFMLRRVSTREMTQKSIQRCFSLGNETTNSLRSIFMILSLSRITQQHFVMHQSVLMNQEQEMDSLRRRYKELCAQRETLLAQRIEEVKRRRYAEASAAVFAEESLLRHSTEEEALKGQMEIVAIEKRTRPPTKKPTSSVEVINSTSPKASTSLHNGLSERHPLLPIKASSIDMLPTEAGNAPPLYHAGDPQSSMLNSISKGGRPRKHYRADSSIAIAHNSVIFASHSEEDLQCEKGILESNEPTHCENGASSRILSSLYETSSASLPFSIAPIPGDTVSAAPDTSSDTTEQKNIKKSRFFQRPLPRPVPPSAMPSFAPLSPNLVTTTKKRSTTLSVFPKGRKKKNNHSQRTPIHLVEQESPQPRRPQSFLKADHHGAVVGGGGLSEISALTFALRQQRHINGGREFRTPPRRRRSESLAAGAAIGGTSFPLESLKKGDDVFADLF